MPRVITRPRLTATEQVYFIEVFKGLMTTIGHAVRNFVRPNPTEGLYYPEVQPDIPRDYRAQHRLMKRPDGNPRCVACFMCSTACPARCIEIVAEESPDGHIEKRPKVFDIDLLLCIYCGMCVEACPCDAIRMDTRKAVIVEDAREKFIIDRERLLDWDPADYPTEDTVSQEAPGGLRNEEALRTFRSGTEHGDQKEGA